jgi:hypothetical protein
MLMLMIIYVFMLYKYSIGWILQFTSPTILQLHAAGIWNMTCRLREYWIVSFDNFSRIIIENILTDEIYINTFKAVWSNASEILSTQWKHF